MESCLPRSAGAACAGGSDGSNKKLCSQVVAHLRPPRRPLHPAARTLAVDLLQPQRQTWRLAWPNPYGPESPKVTRLGGNRLELSSLLIKEKERKPFADSLPLCSHLWNGSEQNNNGGWVCKLCLCLFRPVEGTSICQVSWSTNMVYAWWAIILMGISVDQSFERMFPIIMSLLPFRE